MRLAPILLWVLVVVGIVYLWMRRGLPSRARPPVLPYDELVKDPVCNTYISRSRAVRHTDSTGLHYFCSAACARRYASLG